MKTLLRSRLVLGTAFVALLGGITYACKDFLNTPAQGALDQNTLLTKVGVEGSLIAAYRMLDCTENVGSWGCAASNWSFGDITSDDAYKGSEASDQPQATQIELYGWSTDQGQEYIDEKWATVYEGVSRANATLRLLAQVRASKPGEIPAADASSIEGEARFLRAHYHFEAWRMWGNVPYYFETDTDFKKPNNLGADSVAKLILADLDAAIALLPSSPRNGEAGRASQWTAKAYKGRVQTYTGDYAGALATFNDVTTNGPYALETSFDHVWTGFQALKNGKETIFAFEASANDGEPSGWNANWGERLNFPHSGSPFGCCGFHQPSQNLLNFYAVDAGTGLPLAIVSPTTWNNRNATWIASASDVVDPRLDWTVGRDSVPYKDWGFHTPEWIRAPGYGGPYSPKKNVHEKASGAQSSVGWNKEQLNSVHIHLFRYADLLLMQAEAAIRAQGAAGIPLALANVDSIRARASRTAQGCGGAVPATPTTPAETIFVAKYPLCKGDTRMAVAINDPTITWATYKVGLYSSFADTAAAMAAIRTERRLELAMEGQRFFDLKRWGQAYAAQTINDYLNVEKTRRTYKQAQSPFAARNMFYPIPQIEIDLSKVGAQSALAQNPGW